MNFKKDILLKNESNCEFFALWMQSQHHFQLRVISEMILHLMRDEASYVTCELLILSLKRSRVIRQRVGVMKVINNPIGK